MFRVTKIKPSKPGYFLLYIDTMTALLPSKGISVGIVNDRHMRYAQELKDTFAKPENLMFLRYIFETSHKKGALVIESRLGDWVLDGFMQYIRVHQQAFYMAFGLPLTDEEKQISNLVYG